ncbi:hypothetical protein DY000_02007851 [Brassica cretica]|uniref:Uncharacterized protein n=1 Tax=Brassica cretica TaxID=69181 RepID=A0ABQ7CLP1_BRACR|nr:hypothetical protein DY000_02007851 [Brassica cretica]
MSYKEFTARHPHTPSPVYVKIDRQTGLAIDRQRETTIDRQPPAPIDRRAPLTYRVQMPEIDVTRLNALRPQRKPSANPPETTSTHSDDAAEPMEVDKAHMGRTLRKRKGKIAKHLKREANEKEMENFQKRVFKIPLEKPFEEAYFTHRLWMFFRETKETEEDIRRMFYEAREKMKNRITLKKKSDPGKPSRSEGGAFQGIVHFCGGLVRNLEVQIGNALVPVDFHVLDIKLNWNSSLLLGRAFLIDDRGRAEYETEYSTSIKTHTATSIDSAPQKSIDIHKEESIDSSPGDWENDYYNPTMAVDTAIPTKDTLQTEEYDDDYEEERAIDCTRASTDIANYPSIDTEVDRVREGDYSIGSWADDHYHESYAVETIVHDRGENEPHEGFTYEELLNYQECSDTDSLFAQACGRGTSFYRPFNRATRPSIDITTSTTIDIYSQPLSAVRKKAKLNNNYLTPDDFGIFSNPEGYARAIDGHALQTSFRWLMEQKISSCKNTTFQSTSRELKTSSVIQLVEQKIVSSRHKYREHTRPSIHIDNPTSIDRHP